MPTWTLTVTVDDIPPSAVNKYGVVEATKDDAEQSGSHRIATIPAHIHSFTSDGNKADQPVWLSSGGTTAAHLCVGSIVEISKGSISPDWDYCTKQGCCYPRDTVDPNRFVATEDVGLHKSVQYKDDCGGEFGKLTADGSDFIVLPASDVEHITHYRVGGNLAPGSKAHVWMVVDDAGVAADCVEPGFIGTVKDGPVDGTKFEFGVDDCPADMTIEPEVDDDDACGCSACEGDGVPAHSSINPLNGAVSFDVPLTGWTSKGMPLELALSYNSNSAAAPKLDSPDLPDVNPVPDMAHLSERTPAGRIACPSSSGW